MQALSYTDGYDGQGLNLFSFPALNYSLIIQVVGEGDLYPIKDLCCSLP